ncbi:hypothetical protein NIES4071_44690 [Calothrix sp. NIES-4071]|nr:hypothetical protein NIES4071_44690 [Calothrix sp. NIES-4071]BAZ58782.1 hypothetical protein NIES4105_44620 [Calothrix sp. NIES-4105]
MLFIKTCLASIRIELGVNIFYERILTYNICLLFVYTSLTENKKKSVILLTASEKFITYITNVTDKTHPISVTSVVSVANLTLLYGTKNSSQS